MKLDVSSLDITPEDKKKLTESELDAVVDLPMRECAISLYHKTSGNTRFVFKQW